MTADKSNPLDAELRTLPQAQVPAHLAAAVMARIERIEGERRAAPAREVSAGWSGWVTATGAALAAAALVFAAAAGEPFDLLLRDGFELALLHARSALASVLLLALGLALYIAGLFAAGNSGH